MTIPLASGMPLRSGTSSAPHHPCVGAVAVAQSMFPLWAYHPAVAGLRVHLSNGLYANAVFDRLVGNWSARRAA